MAVRVSDFGLTKYGKEAHLYTLENEAGMKAVLSDLGAVIKELWVPDRDGNLKDVVLGYDTLEGYEEKNSGPSLGAVVGRSANRIGGSVFELNGEKFELTPNENGNNLHSGPDMYFTRRWTTGEYGTDANGNDFVEFWLFSLDGDQGYPGNLELTVTYTLSKDNALYINYSGFSDKDTVVNLTNHSYFNLAGEDSGSVLDHVVQLNCDYYTPTDSESIPTGEIAPVAGTPMDFTEAKTIGRDIEEDFEALKFGGGYDHNYVINGYDVLMRKKAVEREMKREFGGETCSPSACGSCAGAVSCGSAFRPDGEEASQAGAAPDFAAQKEAELTGRTPVLSTILHIGSLTDPASGRCMEMYTDLPGVQMYSANFLNADGGIDGWGKGGRTYGRREGVCFETQYYPNAINTPNFPSPVVKAAEPFSTTTVYKFSVK